MPATKSAVIGGFVLGGLVLGVLAILLFGGAYLFAPVTRAVVFFQGSVAGLSVGAPVTFRGVRVGSVQRIALVLDPKDLQANIPVYLRLEPDQISLAQTDLSSIPIEVERLVNAGLRAQLAMQSIVTGQLQVDLDFRPYSPVRRIGPQQGTHGVQEIPAIPSELQQFKDQISGLPLRDLVERANRALQAFERLAGTWETDISPVGRSARATLDTTRETMEATQRAVVALQADALKTLQDLDQLTNDSRRQIGESGALVNRALASTDRTMRDAGAAMTALNGMIEPRSALRSNLEATMRDLAASAGSLRGFASELERNPSLILMGRGNR
jgi:paraquat-inducible protein B